MRDDQLYDTPCFKLDVQFDEHINDKSSSPHG